MRVIVETDIAAPRQVVWNYIVDPDHQLEFMDGMTKWEVEGTKRSGLGARFSTRMRIGSAELGGRIEIVEFDPPGDMAWTSVTGIEQRGRWRLRRGGDDGTHVELRVTYHAPGGIMASLADLVASPIVKGHFQRSLNTLKQQVEALPRATSKSRRHARARRQT